jgi:hypothetical protein
MKNKLKIKLDSYAEKFEKQPITFFKNGWKEIQLPEYPKDTKKEIMQIKKMMSEKTKEENKEILKHDKKEPPFELEYLKIVGDKSKDGEDFIYRLTGQLFTICLYFKKKFNRERPFQAAKELDIEFPVVKTETGVTPAYPSGHAFSAYTVAEILSKKYPDKKKELFDLAEKIAVGRIKHGVHFPSDIEGGKILAKKLLNFYKPSAEGLSFKEFFSYFD